MPLPHDAVATQRFSTGWVKRDMRTLAVKPAWPHSTFIMGISPTFDLHTAPPFGLEASSSCSFFLFLLTISTPPPSQQSTIVWPGVLILRAPPALACLSCTGGRGGRGDLKAPPGLKSRQHGRNQSLLKELDSSHQYSAQHAVEWFSP